eukprot:1053364-Prorocentrum_minimum.AAC.5
MECVIASNYTGGLHIISIRGDRSRQDFDYQSGQNFWAGKCDARPKCDERDMSSETATARRSAH